MLARRAIQRTRRDAASCEARRRPAGATPFRSCGGEGRIQTQNRNNDGRDGSTGNGRRGAPTRSQCLGSAGSRSRHRCSGAWHEYQCSRDRWPYRAGRGQRAWLPERWPLPDGKRSPNRRDSKYARQQSGALTLPAGPSIGGIGGYPHLQTECLQSCPEKRPGRERTANRLDRLVIDLPGDPVFRKAWRIAARPRNSSEIKMRTSTRIAGFADRTRSESRRTSTSEDCWSD